MNAASWLENLPAPGRWRELTLAHGPRIATWVLALALGVQAALILTDLTGGKARVSAASSAPSAPPPRAHVNVAAIANAHLFGSAQVAAAATDAENAPRTSIPLVLTGIIATNDPRYGFAILGENAGATKVVPVGDMVPGGAKLHSVYREKVVLDRNGALESLELPRDSAPGGPMAPPPQVSSMPAESPVVDRMRQLIASEPGVISDIMRPQPVFAQGKQRGYRVYPGRNRQAFIRLGLRPGDLVTAINGTPLDDPARGQEIFQTLGSSAEANVTVMRNGREQNLSLNLAQVAQEAEQLVGAGDGAPDQGDAPPPPPPNPGESGNRDE